MAPHQTSPLSGTPSLEAEMPRRNYNSVPSTIESPWAGNPQGPELAKPVAIIGMAMRLPGGVHSGDGLWDLLSQKKSGLCDIPKNRFNAAGFYDPARGPGTIPVNKGYFLQDVQLEEFDTSVFPIPKMELERLDPCQRQLLQVAYECLENAGVTSWRGSRTGCYIGEFGEDYADVSARETQQRGSYRYTGLADFAVANRLSYELDLQGPSMAVKTACSSSLVCLDLACKAIQSGECDSALVGGVSMIFSPTTYISVTDLGVISPNGQCRSFDAGADGYARGEAINMVIVKRLDHALRDNDPIRAVIRASGVNTDGRTNGMLTPSSTVQANLIRHTYEAAGIDDLSQTAVMECHGTGTPVGDPIETEAVGRCFGDSGVIITSVKPNLGHAEAAAGLSSLIKCILSLEHQQVLPNINFETPNLDIPFEKYKLRVPTEVEPWPQDRAERMSINAFGIGGVNAHVIIDSPKQFGINNKLSNGLANSSLANNTLHTNGDHISNINYTNSTHAKTIGSYTNGNHVDATPVNGVNGTNGTQKQKQHASNLLVFSAYSTDSLDRQISAYRDYTAAHGVSLQDLAYTLTNRRDHKPYRAYAIANDASGIEEASTTVNTAVDETPPRVGWIFTGQGAQWPEMGAKLIDTNIAFRSKIRKLDKYLQTLKLESPVSIEAELRKTKDDSRVHRPEMGHLLCVALQVALVDVLSSWGIVPEFVLGHSSGETAAAYACGAITAEAAIYAATRRGIGNASSQRKGSMAAVGLGRDEIQPFVLPGVNIACENSHSNVTLSGDTEQVERIIETLKSEKPGAFARLLRVEKAYHSHHMHEYGPVYEEQLKPVVHSVEPKIPFYSSVTGDRLTGDGKLGASYWRANMENTVLFNPALRSALNDQPEKVLLIEVGPHPALAGPVGQIIRDLGRSDMHVGTCVRGNSCDSSLLHLAGKLYQQSIAVDFSVICPPGAVLKDLPRYSWNKDTTHWEESRVARGWRLRENPPHELLGSRLLETEGEPCWRKVLALEDTLWLNGHEVNGQVVFPAAGYICMVGEALRQLTGNETFTVRNVRIMSALILSTDKVVELVTVLRPTTVDTSDNSEWYEFTVTSFDGTAWVRNCYGEAMASADRSFHLDSVSAPAASSFPRKVDKRKSYDILRRVGFNYTGAFEGLTDISVSTTSLEAYGVTSQGRGAPDDKSRCSIYSLYPAVIDQCFQLFTIALCRGLRRSRIQLAVPTFIEEMVVSPSASSLNVTAQINRLDEVGSWTGDFVALGAEAPILSLKGMKSAVLTRSSTESELPLITELEWRPHSDFVGLETGLHPRVPRKREWALLEELILLCNLDHLDQIKTDDTTAPYLIKLLDWMRLVIDRYRSGKNLFVSKDAGLEHLDHDQRVLRIDAIMVELADTQDAVFARAIHRLFVEAPSIFAGDGHPLHILMPDNVLSDFYDATSFDMADAVRMVANTNPHMRVLEVGAGTGSMTARLLRALTSSHGERLYSHYGYTDVSAGFIAVGKQRFTAVENIEYDVLDISKEPEEQGFELGSYDLVIASNVLHATSSLDTTLRNVHGLLKPSGRLFLEELTPDAMFVNYVMGFFYGWWLGAEDGRVEQPWVAPECWVEKLTATGFQKPEAIVLDSAVPYQISAGIIASRGNRSTLPSKVAILCHTTNGPYLAEMRRRLDSMGIAVETCLWGQPLPDCDIISLLDLHEPLLHEMSEEIFKTIVGYFQKHKARMIWVTEACQIDCQNPKPAMTLGLARTVRNEYSLDLFTVELDNSTTVPRATEAVVDILCRVSTPDLSLESMDHDHEYAIVDGNVLIPRFHWQTVTSAFAGAKHTEDYDGTVKRINMSTPGLLHTMRWADGISKAPAKNEVLVEVKAVGLNFRDVILALGVVEGNPSGMGHEGSGVIRAIGPDVQDFSVGDRVMFINDGCFTTQLTLPKDVCVKIDDSMSFVQGAALPAVYATALAALVDASRLQRGQSVLIHAACGGVGLAAIQIAQMIGAEIYCTVGSEAKRKYLEDNYGIPSNHIFNSRDVTFLPDVMRATKGRGVDVVLNSLSGDLLHASWKCVAEFGFMVEIGKRDFQRRSKLAMETFEANRTFVGLDIRGLSISHPEKATDLMSRCVEMIRSGTIQGPVACTSFLAVNIQDAYRYMQAAKHIGKIVIEMPEDPRVLSAPSGEDAVTLQASPNPNPSFRADRSYLLVGGLGGLGRAVATWMVDHGARVLVLLSRSAREGPDNQDFLNDLRSQGCQVLLVSGSVSSLEDVQRAIDIATTSQPLAGLINLSMVLRDVTLNKMTFSDWTTAVEPKVRGTWNLHHATAASPLDFFILFSSQNAQIGQWGQANYAAANTFLDAFAQYRHGQNLVASVIDVGLMGDVGFAAENRAILKSLGRIGMYILQEQDLLESITLALLKSQPFQKPGVKTSYYYSPGYVGIGLNTTTPMSAASTRVPWKRDARMSIYHNLDKTGGDLTGESSSKGSSLKNQLAAEPSEETKIEIVAKALAGTLGTFLIKDESSFPLDKPLKMLGMDSLIAMEVRNWVRQNIGADISTFTILQSPSFIHLANEIRVTMTAGSEE